MYKPNTTKPKQKTTMTLMDAERFLRKMDEWHGVVKMERDTIIKWAIFLKEREEKKIK